MIRLVLLLMTLLTSASSLAAPRRFALVVGENLGDPTDPALQYAEEDARRLSDTLQRVGDFDQDDLVTLLRPSVKSLRVALSTVLANVAEAEGETLLVVFYSGHADAESLHLRGGRFPLAELRDTIAKAPASARVLVLDACRSGSLTRVKGGRPGPAFDVHLETPVEAKGLAILTSSAAGEDAQESDDLRGSFFTHYFVSALLGAGDRDRDGAVTVDEAFGYAADRTVAATSATSAGPQHPTYRYELGGRQTLVLTRPGQLNVGMGVLEFPHPGWYLVRRGGGPILAELHTDERDHKLTLPAGRYQVTRRTTGQYYEGEIDVSAGSTTTVTDERFARFDYLPVARKGPSSDRPPSWKPIYATGLALFCGTVLATQIWGIASSSLDTANGDLWLSQVPVVGPIVNGAFHLHDAGQYDLAAMNGRSDYDRAAGALLLLDGIAQMGGLAMAIAGHILLQREQRSRSLPNVLPFVSARSIGVSGSF